MRCRYTIAEEGLAVSIELLCDVRNDYVRIVTSAGNAAIFYFTVLHRYAIANGLIFSCTVKSHYTAGENETVVIVASAGNTALFFLRGWFISKASNGIFENGEDFFIK